MFDDSADDRTLRLSVPPLSEDDVLAYVRYLRALHGRSHADPQAHLEALTTSRLSPAAHAVLAPMMRDFSGKRWAVRHLKRREQELTSQGGPAAEAKLKKLRLELRRMEDLGGLERRYGVKNVALLLTHEDALVDGHPR